MIPREDLEFLVRDAKHHMGGVRAAQLTILVDEVMMLRHLADEARRLVRYDPPRPKDAARLQMALDVVDGVRPPTDLAGMGGSGRAPRF